MDLTKDDERARRICSLALEFMNAASPLSSTQIARDHYPDRTPEGFRRAFARDRKDLAACGVSVVEHDNGALESTWSADPGISFAAGCELTAAEAASLELACRPLADDPSWPLADELRFALAKLSRAFAEAAGSAAAPSAPQGRILKTLRSCLVRRHAARVLYTNAAKETSERVIAPYGFFTLRGTLYLVAARMDGDEAPTAEPRTYRVERIGAATELPKEGFHVPDGFDVSSYRKLPFQLGPAAGTAEFLVPASRLDDLLRASHGRGTLAGLGARTAAQPGSAPQGMAWSVEASSYPQAAAWAVALGIRPLAPQMLVDDWTAVLEGAAKTPLCPPVPRPAQAARAPRVAKATGRPGSLDEARALVALASSLSERGDALTARAVSAKLGVDEARAARLIRLVVTACAGEDSRLPLVEGPDEDVTLVFDGGLRGRPLRLGAEESLAMTAALDALGVADDDPLRSKVASLAEPSRTDQDLLGRIVGEAAGPGAPEALLTCAGACARGRAVSFLYKKEGAEAQARRAVPQALRPEDGLWYLDAWDEDRRGARTFRIDRMSDVREQAAGTAEPAGAGRAPRHMVGLHFGDASFLDLLPWHELELGPVEEDGSRTARTPWYGGPWLVRMVAACGGSCATDDDALVQAVRGFARSELEAAAGNAVRP